jgi:hypothetical protein
VVFFGILSYAPNVDGVTRFPRHIWPRTAEVQRDGARPSTAARRHRSGRWPAIVSG